jgi:amino acid adenylation domain-containing protein/non-ribosomal peptide synthase protein (TIGR01720 family)
MKNLNKLFFTERIFQPYFSFWKKFISNLQTGFSFYQKTPNNQKSFLHTSYIIKYTTEHPIYKLVQEKDTGIFVCFMAVFTILLKKYTGESCVVIATPLNSYEGSDQVHDEIVSIPLSVESQNSLREHLNNLRETIKECYEYQNFPLQLLDSSLESKSQFSNVLITADNVHRDVSDTSDFDLIIGLKRAENEITVSLDYNAAAYDDFFISNIKTHSLKVIDSLTNLDTQIKDIDIIAEEEKRQIQLFNQSPLSGKFYETTIIELFENQVEKTPDSTALIYHENALSYRELNRMANQVAGLLRNKYAVKPNQIIGIIADHSDEFIISIIGIIKAGAAYLPLDIHYPASRINFILKDASVALVVNTINYPVESSEGFECVTFADLLKSTTVNEQNLPIVNTPSDLAYIIYTSGSTGYPKGVKIQHKGVCNLLEGLKLELKIQAEWKYILTSSISFDASVKQIFIPLTSGSELHLLKDSRDVPQLIGYINNHKINVMHAVPALWAQIMDQDQYELQQLKSLCCISSGGEKLSKELANKMYYTFQGSQLYNTYGPTEACINATFYQIKSPLTSPSSIGRPLPNYKIFILNDDLCTQAVGVAGDIYIAGIGLADGYIKHPDLNKKVFIQSSFIEGTRLYRTGDLGRWSPDGDIEFVGRKDEQVKLRGYRVELGEVEQILLQHESIRETVVLVSKNQNKEDVLIAYFVKNNTVSVKELRSYLSELLPDYMIPDRYIVLDKMPLSPAGKIDKKLLIYSDGELLKSTVRYSAPQSLVEERLVRLWTDILKQDNIGISHNFFDLGGNSLTAAKLIARVYKEFGVTISLRKVFEHPTISHFAMVLEGEKNAGFKQIIGLPVKEYYETSYGQKRQWLVDQNTEEQLAYTMAGAYLFEGKLNIQAFKNAFLSLAERHESFRSVFIPFGGEVKQKIQTLEESKFEVEVIDYSKITDGYVKALQSMELEEKKPYSLEEGPLVKVKLYVLQKEQFIFLLSLDHIIADGYSMEILIAEFLLLYNGFNSGTTKNLPPLRIQYKEFAAWQNELLKNQEYLTTHTGYWLDQFSGEIPTLNLAADKHPGLKKSYQGKKLQFELDPQSSEGLRTLIRKCNVTLFMTFLALTKAFLYKLTGQKDIVVGTGVAGRNHVDLENQVGLYANILPLRTCFDDSISFTEFLNTVRLSTLKAYDHQDYPFLKLIEDLDLNWDPSKTPLFDVMLMVQRDYARDIVIDGVGVTEVPLKSSTSLFDLYFNVKDKQDVFEIDLTYSVDLFDAETIFRYTLFFKELVKSILSDPNQSLSRLNLVPANFQIKPEKLESGTYIMDHELNDLPQGLVGDIYIDLSKVIDGNDFYRGLEIVNYNGKSLINTRNQGRLLANGSVETLDLRSTGFLVEDKYYLASYLELLLTDYREIDECIILNQKGFGNANFIVAHIKCSQEFNVENCVNYLGKYIPKALTDKLAFNQLNSLPLKNGAIDIHALNKATFLAEQVINDIENKICAIDEVTATALIIKNVVPGQSHLHLSDIFVDENSVVESCAAINLKSNKKELQDSKKTALEKQAYIQGKPLVLNDTDPKTITEAFIETCNKYPQKGIIIPQINESDYFLSYADLNEQARCILQGLYNQNLKQDDNVLVQVSDLREFFPVFWACVLGGIIPVIVAVPPVYNKENSVVEKLLNAWQLLNQPLIIASDNLVEPIEALTNLFLLDDQIISVSVNILKNNTPVRDIILSSPDDLIYYQLSSGSTGDSKAIGITHKGVVNYVLGAQRYNNYSPDDISLNWMPLDHVAALVTFHLKDVYLGIQQIQYNTTDIIKNPLIWAECIQKYKVTHSWSPNFGYKLISEELEAHKDFHCDLSSLKLLLNGGDQVTLNVIMDFLQQTSKFGINPLVMQPAYGMAEVCTAVTFNNTFTADTGVIYADKNVIDNEITIVDSKDERANIFISVGGVRDGVELRISDADDNIVSERTIGKIQIRTESRTPGYLHNEEANKTAFLEDGWYNTGDLGFISDGSLFVTGREKEMMIVRGVHYYYYTIEEFVGEIEGVIATYVGCCSIKNNVTETEELAVFFTPVSSNFEDQKSIIRKIKTAVTAKFGIDPYYIIPVEKSDFSKTTSGKIQRAMLRKILQKGTYNEIIKKVDISLESELTTIPDWFSQKTWTYKNAITTEDNYGLKKCLVFCNEKEFSLQSSVNEVINVRKGAGFEVEDQYNYVIDPGNEQHYQALMNAIADNGTEITDIIHSWNRKENNIPANRIEIENAEITGIYSLLYLTKALPVNKPIKLYVITNNSQVIFKNEILDYGKASIPGFLKTLSLEADNLSCRHIDIPFTETNIDQLVTNELYINKADNEVAYRNGKRYISQLTKVNISELNKQPIQIIRGGVYLVTGGLGAIGYEIAKLLLKEYQAKLILIGRTYLDKKQDIDSKDQPVKAERLKTLQQQSSEVVYHSADICDLSKLLEIKVECEEKWGRKLDGILHLAGEVDAEDQYINNLDERLIPNLTIEEFKKHFQSKIYGTCVLSELIKDNPSAIFVAFSSALSYFGGYASAPYAAANGFLDSFILNESLSTGRQAQSLNWSIWDTIGVNEQSNLKKFNIEKGFKAISALQGVNSFKAALKTGFNQLFIGLDLSNNYISRRTTYNEETEALIELYVETESGSFKDDSILAQLRAYSKNKNVVTRNVSKLAVGPDGMVDKRALQIHANLNDKLQIANIDPRNKVEQQLANIWREILNRSRISVTDNFFEIGGHSIKAVRVISRIHQEMDVMIDLKDLFSHSTIEKLGKFISKSAFNSFEKIQPVAEAEYYDVSHSQKRLWIFDQFDKGLTAYNFTQGYIIEGKLDSKAFKKAIDELVRRHEVLRTTFVSVNGEPKQKINPACNSGFELKSIDLRKDQFQDNTIEELINNELDIPFDLTNGPLLRAYLIQAEAEKTIFLLSMHHIITDGWSMQVLFEEITLCYNSFCNGKIPTLNELQIQYKDFAAWQNEELTEDKLANPKNYWLQQFSNEIPVLELPTDFPRLVDKTFSGNKIDFFLGKGIKEELALLGQKKEASLFMVLLAAVKVLLNKYTGQTDIVVGTPVAGRNRIDLENQIGFYVNTIPLRTAFNEYDSFEQLLIKVKDSTLNGFEHQLYPFDKLIEDLDLPRDMSRSPLFDVLVVLQNTELRTQEELQMNNVRVSELPIGSTTSKFDLTFNFSETDGIIQVTLEYNSYLFSNSRIARIKDHFAELLNSILEHSNKPVYSLSYLPEAEKHLLLEKFNDNYAPLPVGQTIHNLFEEQVNRSPESIAIVYNNETLTYRQLNEKANQLANYLRENYDIKPDSIVALMLNRSARMAVSILAVLKAGGAYLPLDANYPPERITYVLGDASVAVVIFDDQEAIEKYNRGSYRCISLDDQEQSITRYSTTNLNNVNKVNDLAYVIYTSGSTGQPKGVMIAHYSNVNMSLDQIKQFGITSDDNVLQFASLSFDASVSEIFMALYAGATLTFVDKSVIDDTYQFTKLLKQNRISVITLPPAYLNIIDLSQLKGLRVLITAGESPDVNNAVYCSNFCNYFNAYGPTECAVCVSVYKVSETDKNKLRIPVGRPIANTQVYIVDKYQQPVALGIEGELCVSGPGLARGYINQPQLTNEKFIDSPFKTGEKLYRTGDWARWTEDGNIEFFGRKDNQLKIRGYRIELSEIEKTILNNNAVEQCIVLAREVNFKKQLVAYLKMRHNKKQLKYSEFRNIKSELDKFLPFYMIPTFFLEVEDFPVTINGKIDFKRLPLPETAVYADGISKPKNNIEEILLKTWEHVIGRTNIGTESNFFEIGGDSIKAIQIASAMHREGYKVEVKDIFKNQKISELAKAVKNLDVISDQRVVTGVLPLSPIQQEFFSWGMQKPHFFNQSVSLDTKDRLDADIVREVFLKLIEHHDALRINFKSENAQFIQFNNNLEYPFFLEEYESGEDDHLKTFDEKVAALQSSLNLEEGPLIKVALFKGGAEDHLLIVVHHLVVDMLSWRILLEDINLLFQLKKQGKKLSLPLKTDSFKTWTEAVVAYAASNNLKNEIPYWSEIENSVTDTLPVDFESELNTVEDSRSLTFVLDKVQTELLLTKVNEKFNTEINDILLAALGLAFNTVFGINKILLSLEGHGREEISSSINVGRTVGWFTSLFPVLITVSKSTGRLIKEVKEQLRKIPLKGIGYGILKHFSDNGKQNFTITPQISFNYLGQFDADLGEKFFNVNLESIGRQIDLKEKRRYNFDISAFIGNGQLNIIVNYSHRQYKVESVRKLTEAFYGGLTDIINYCCSLKQEKELTPHDLTYKDLTINQLEELGRLYKIDNIYELSPMQEGLYFHSLTNTESSTYFEQMSYKLKGRLNIKVVKESLNILFKHYDILRTAFVHENVGRALQIVVEDRKIDFYSEDISALSDLHEKEIVVSKFKEKDRRKTFDLSKDVLMRMTVFQINKEEFEVIWSHHHILMDGWCLAILISQFFEVYNNLLNEQIPKLLPVQPFSVYINWLKKQDKYKAKSYWAKYLHGYKYLASLPGNEIIQQGIQYQKDELVFKICADKTDAIKSLASSYNVTVNTFIQTLWGILLSKYNNTTDVVYGAVVSGRSSEIQGVEQMLGLFINTVPVRFQYHSDTSFISCMKQMQETAIETEPYHFLQLAEIQSETDLKQNLLDHILVFVNYPVDEQISSGSRGIEGLSLSEIEIFEQTSYNLNLRFIPGEELTLNINFNSVVYERDFLKSLWGHFEQVVDQIILNPEILVADIDILTQADYKILNQFNATIKPYPENKTIQHLFEEQALLIPEEVAVVFENVELNYNELNRKANQLAHYLRDNYAIKPDKLIGLMVNRSERMIIGLLGILKAGAAYVPIDPSYPLERKKLIMLDCNIDVLLTDSDMLIGLSDFYEGELLALDIQLETLPENYLNPEILNSPTSLAYVMYTSGSTGKPKGVMVEHKNIIRLISNTTPFKIKAGEKLLQTGSLSFDASTFEIWGMLLKGGQLHLVSQEDLLEITKLKHKLITYKISMIWFTSSWFNQLADSDIELFGTLKYLVVGGEQLSPKHISKVQNRFPTLHIINGYGPTEATTFSTFHEIESLGAHLSPISIGKPLDNTRVYILDSQKKKVPVGIEGELYIGGDGISRGYLNNDKLTSERFIKLTGSEERLYLTGDLGRWKSNGTIAFSGRKDKQVKIRGHRIELEEVEHILAGFNSIEKTCVTINNTNEGTKQLIAYYTNKDAEEINKSAIHAYLKNQLPDYMVPTLFIEIDTFPLTPNGKIDFNALPDPSNNSGRDTDYIAAGSETEIALTEVWKDVLGKESIGIRDNFFMIGGDSIKAIQVSSRMQSAGYKVEVKDLFIYPTIEELALVIRKTDKETDQSAVEGWIPLTPVQLCFFSRQLLKPHHFNQSMMLQAVCGFETEAISAVLRKLQEHHDILRVCFKGDSKQLQQFNNKDNYNILETYDLKNAEDPTRTMDELANQMQGGINIQTGPLIKVALFHLDNKDLLLITAHHLIIDGVSWRILLEDFETLLVQYKAGKTLKLPLKTESYQTWAQQITAYANSPSILKEKEYWRLLESVKIEKLVTDDNLDIGKVSDTCNQSFSVSARDTHLLLNNVNQAFNTEINDILLVSMGIAFKKVFGKENILIALEGHGREEILENINISRTMGWFTSIYPLVLNLSGEDDFATIIKNTKEILRKIPAKGIGYGILKYLTAPENKQELKFNLNPEICFNYLGQFDADLANKSFTIADESTGNLMDRHEKRFYNLDITGLLIDEQLTISIAYSSKNFDIDTICDLKDSFNTALINVIQYCSSKKDKELTPSDFTYEGLSVSDLEAIKAQFD